jgi:hypothetical protein
MNKIFDVASGALVVAAIFVMVRPGSQGPTLVSNIGSAYSNVIKAATGGGSW